MLQLMLKITSVHCTGSITDAEKGKLTGQGPSTGHADSAGQQNQRKLLINNNFVHSFTFQRSTQGPDRTR